MKLCTLLTTLWFPILASATTLEAVVSAFVLPANATYSANDWSATNAIPGVKWQHQGLKETPVSPFTRSGSVSLDNLPAATVFFSGARTMVMQLDMFVGGNGAPAVDKRLFAQMLRSQFRSGTRFQELQGGCKDEGAMWGSAVYGIAIPGKKPVYLRIDTDAGTGAPGSQVTSLQFQHEPLEAWRCR